MGIDVNVTVAVAVGVGVRVGVGVGVLVAVGVNVRVGVSVAVRVGVGVGGWMNVLKPGTKTNRRAAMIAKPSSQGNQLPESADAGCSRCSGPISPVLTSTKFSSPLSLIASIPFLSRRLSRFNAAVFRT